MPTPRVTATWRGEEESASDDDDEDESLLHARRRSSDERCTTLGCTCRYFCWSCVTLLVGAASFHAGDRHLIKLPRQKFSVPKSSKT